MLNLEEKRAFIFWAQIQRIKDRVSPSLFDSVRLLAMRSMNISNCHREDSNWSSYEEYAGNAA
jgi:hypothetical protein